MGCVLFGILIGALFTLIITHSDYEKWQKDRQTIIDRYEALLKEHWELLSDIGQALVDKDDLQSRKS